MNNDRRQWAIDVVSADGTDASDWERVFGTEGLIQLAEDIDGERAIRSEVR